jgi:hypothetical protein
MALTNCTITSSTTTHTGGAADITTRVLTITPDVGFSVSKVAGGFASGSTPSGVASIVLADTGTAGEVTNTISVTVDFTDAFVMPLANTLFELNISGKAIPLLDTIDIQIALVHPFDGAPNATIGLVAADGISIANYTTATPHVSYMHGTILNNVSTKVATVTMTADSATYTTASGGWALTNTPFIYPLSSAWTDSFDKFDWIFVSETVVNGFTTSIVFDLFFKDIVSHSTPLQAGEVINGRSTHLDVTPKELGPDPGLTIDSVEFGDSTNSGDTIPGGGVYPPDDSIEVNINGSVGSTFTIGFAETTTSGGTGVVTGVPDQVLDDENVLQDVVQVIPAGGTITYNFTIPSTTTVKEFTMTIVAGDGSTTVNSALASKVYNQRPDPVIDIRADIPDAWTTVSAETQSVTSTGKPGIYAEELRWKADSMLGLDFELKFGSTGTFAVVRSPGSSDFATAGGSDTVVGLTNLTTAISSDGTHAYIRGTITADKFGLTSSTRAVPLDTLFTYTAPQP